MKRLSIETFGEDNIVQGVTLKGNPRVPEPEAFRISFPFGDVEVVRATDEPGGDYWVHLRVNRRQDAVVVAGDDVVGRLKAARLDIEGKHASDSALGDFVDPGLYHLAVRIGA